MTTTMSIGSGVDDFARHLQWSSPFESNRVADAAQAMPPNVAQIHASEFKDLARLVEKARNHDGMGAMLWGEPGVGKSHLLARLWHDLRHKSCVTFLHNVQASSDRLPRYVLKCVLGQIARSPTGRLMDGTLNGLIAAGIRQTLGQFQGRTMADAYTAFRQRFIEPAIATGRTDQEIIYELLFAYFQTIYRAQGTEQENPHGAKFVIRWLGGDRLDADELAAIGLPPAVSVKMRDYGLLRLPDDQAVEAVVSAIAGLAAAANQTFVIMFDQVDNLNEDQVSAWARFAHALIDHIPNLLVITSGVRGRLLEMQQSSLVNAASWDRIAQHRIEIGRITPEQSGELLETRLASFLGPFADQPEIRRHLANDSLFPLGHDWLHRQLGTALEIRPRDLINWAQDRFQRINTEIDHCGVQRWLESWPGDSPQATMTPLDFCGVTRGELIDAAIEEKLAEQCRDRQLNPESLPADADNLLGLVQQLLGRCLGKEQDYSLRGIATVDRNHKGPAPAYDLMVDETTPEGISTRTGIKFISTGSKTSSAAMLRRLTSQENPLHHTLIVTEQRCPLQLGQKGREYLSQLESRGANAFACRELTFETHCQLDALQAVIGLANAGDLEIQHPDGTCEALRVDDVIAAYHRSDRFRSIGLLRELLTEDSLPETVASSPTVDHAADQDELKSFVLEELSQTNASTTYELAAKYVSQSGLDHGQTAAVCRSLDQAVLDLHQSRKVVATAQGNHTLVTVPPTAPAGSPTADSPAADITTSDAPVDDHHPLSPIHFTVTQVRQAAACPRLLHLDGLYTRQRKLKKPRVTRIWQESGGHQVGALGTLFHQAVEKFNDSGTRSRRLKELLLNPPAADKVGDVVRDLILLHVNQKQLTLASPQQRDNFHSALSCYTAEFAEILLAGLQSHGSVDRLIDQLFGDRRKSVDVTFEVGPNQQHVHITGRLDYLYYDWRRGGHRIIDYKLTPGLSVDADLYQICIYALMHHQQHGTRPDVALHYLYPQRMIREMSWQEVYDRRHEVYDLLASMTQWQDYSDQPPRGLHPPGNAAYCSTCRYRKQCNDRLGAVGIGERTNRWSESANKGCPAEPTVHRIATQDAADSIEQIERRLDEVAELVTLSPETEPPETEPSPNSGTLSTSPAPRDASGDSGQLCLGKSDTGDTVALPLEILPSHVALVGAAGSGKTWMAKVVAEEAIQQGVPIIAIDPQGDLVQFLQQSDQPMGEFQASSDRYWQQVEPRIFTPGSSHATRMSIDPIRLPTSAGLSNFTVASRRDEEFQGMLSSAVSNLVNLAGIRRDIDMQQTFMMQAVRALIDKRGDQGPALQLRDLAAAVIAPDGIGLEDADLYLPKSQRVKLGRKLMAMLDGPQAKLFSGGTPLDIDALCRPSLPGKVPLNIIYLNALTSDDEKQFFVASLAEELYRWMVSSLESCGRAKLLMYLDEARDYIPKGTVKPLAKEPLIRMFSQGRKYGVSCLMCTQSPRSVDYNIFSNCSTKLIGRLESAQDVDTVSKWFSTDGQPEWLANRKTARRGTFIARWPDMPASMAGVEFRGRPLYSLHEGAWSPDRVEKETAKSKP
ncbi:PD-(D/E)XK nuclease family protein [Rhodopirellula sp. JC639]|uniref:PD-(D/E)XK nuclease family protein n=1 Tax=Stieleria mannarensis TaxID=2755585 RepID=UPI0015FFCEA0|nr:PD-(D/E)XK nuclease family protein [Rhodopirellula sp. JC639]